MKKVLFYTFTFSLLIWSCGSKTNSEEATKEDSAASYETTAGPQAEEKPEVKSTGGKCGEDLKKYIASLDELIELSEDVKKNGYTEANEKKKEDIRKDLEQLGKSINEHKELYIDPECSKAWTDAQMKYTTYMTEKMKGVIKERN
ncbi:MAG: hypothetical protein H6605_02835 [Flavobacteriales bacterium]|nr:hypothetical protein [Flavobacteriales bacterium]